MENNKQENTQDIVNAWRMEIVGVLPLPKEELQVKAEELVEKQKLPEMDSATRRQIEHAMYGKRGRRGYAVC